MIKILVQPHIFAKDENGTKYMVPNQNIDPGFTYVNQQNVCEFQIHRDAIAGNYFTLTIAYIGGMLKAHLISLDEKTRLEQLLNETSTRLGDVEVRKVPQ